MEENEERMGGSLLWLFLHTYGGIYQLLQGTYCDIVHVVQYWRLSREREFTYSHHIHPIWGENGKTEVASTKYASEQWVWCAQKHMWKNGGNEGKPPSFLRSSALWRLAIPALMASLAALSGTFPAHNAIVPVYSRHVGPAPLALIPLLTYSSTYWWALEKECLPQFPQHESLTGLLSVRHRSHLHWKL